MTAAATDADTVLRSLLRGCWTSLPALLAADLTVCAAVTLVVLAAPGINAVSVALLALLVAPTGAALLVTVDAVAARGDATVRDWVNALRTGAVGAIAIAALPAALGEVFVAAWVVWDGGHRPLALPSLLVCGAALAVAVFVLPAAVLIDHRGPRGWRIWLTAARLVGFRPMRAVAAYSLLALGVWLSTVWSASVLVVVPAPVAVVLVAAVRTSKLDAAEQSSSSSMSRCPQTSRRSSPRRLRSTYPAGTSAGWTDAQRNSDRPGATSS